jgi:nucleoside-diphosphate-sugar epimerase
MSINKNTKIYVAGHRGMVGSAIVRQLQAKGFTNIVTRTHAELDFLISTLFKPSSRKKDRGRFTWRQQK